MFLQMIFLISKKKTFLFLILHTFLMLGFISNKFIFSQNILKDQPFFYYKSMADEYRNLKLYNEALRYYNESLKKYPDCLECLYWKAYIYMKKGLYFESLLNIQKLESIIPNNLFFKDAINYYDSKFLKTYLFSKKEKDNEYQDIILKELNNIEKELDSILVKKNKNDDQGKEILYSFLGKVNYYKAHLLKNLSIKEKIALFKRSIYFHYKKDFSYFNLYLMYKELKNVNEAARMLEMAKNLNPNIVMAFEKDNSFGFDE